MLMLALLMMTAALATACTAYDVSGSGVCELSTSQGSNGAAYDAINPKGRRQAPSADTRHEDRHLNQSQRRQMIGGLRSLRRNSSLLGWMVRQHLLYVTEHRFEARTGDDGLDDELELMLAEEFRTENLDERELFDLDEYVMCGEAMAVLDGDFGTVFLNSGKLQPIESDRIRDPSSSYYDGVGLNGYQADLADWFNGVRATTSGRPIEYAVHRRINGWSAFEFERLIPARNLYLHAYRDRFDQLRGVSPVAAAYNQIRDVYEAEEYAMVRSKVASLFAMAITRNADQAAGSVNHEEDEDGNPVRSSYEVDFGRGPVFLDLDPGDDAKFLDSDNPGGNLQDFWRFVTLVALKSLDLPYGLFDESVATFFGNKTAWISYDRSCHPKRKRVRKLLNRVTDFKCQQLIKTRRLTLPHSKTRQITVSDQPWVWVPRGMPWWRPLEEVTANLKAVGGAFTTPQRVCIEADQGNVYDNIDDIAKVMEYAKKRGVPLSYAVDPELAKQVADNRKDAVPPEQQHK